MEREENYQSILASLPTPCHGLLQLAPRFGKTRLALDIIKREKPKNILWVTPNRLLRDISIPKQFKVWKATKYLKKTNIICYSSLHNIEGSFDIIILDEYQYVTEKNCCNIFNEKIKYKSIIGLSGTHPKHYTKKEIYRRLNLHILATMSIDEAVEHTIVAPYKITLVPCILDNTNSYLKAGNAKVSFYQTEYSRYKYFTRLIEDLESTQSYSGAVRINRARLIYNSLGKHKVAKAIINGISGRSLIFTGSIEAAEKLCSNTYHSKTDDTKLKLFIDKKIDQLACVNSAGIGFDFEEVDNFIIVQVNADKRGDSTQKIARSLLFQENYKANVIILYLAGTVDEQWKDKVLQNFNITNVEIKDWRSLVDDKF